MAHHPISRTRKRTADEYAELIENSVMSDRERERRLRHLASLREREREEAERHKATENMGPGELADLVHEHKTGGIQ